jgi:hypothetical protein
MRHILFITLIFIVSSTSIAAQITATSDRSSAKTLKLRKTDLDPTLKIETVTGYPDRTTLVANSSRTFKAFVLCVPSGSEEGCFMRVYVTEIKTGNTYEVNVEPLEVEVMRPVDELKWLDNDRLSYERWTNPHFGRRYVMNVRTRKQVGAWSLTDVK